MKRKNTDDAVENTHRCVLFFKKAFIQPPIEVGVFCLDYGEPRHLNQRL